MFAPTSIWTWRSNSCSGHCSIDGCCARVRSPTNTPVHSRMRFVVLDAKRCDDRAVTTARTRSTRRSGRILIGRACSHGRERCGSNTSGERRARGRTRPGRRVAGDQAAVVDRRLSLYRSASRIAATRPGTRRIAGGSRSSSRPAMRQPPVAPQIAATGTPASKELTRLVRPRHVLIVIPNVVAREDQHGAVLGRTSASTTSGRTTCRPLS